MLDGYRHCHGNTTLPATFPLFFTPLTYIHRYFLNLFGLRSVFTFILGDDNAANQMAAQMGGMSPAGGAGMFAPGQDPHKMFLAEAENLEVVGGQHEWVLDGVVERLLAAHN